MKSKSSTSSAASEGSALDSKEPDLFGPLLSVNESRFAKPSSKSTGLKSQSLTTSKNSEARNPHSQMELISSAAGSRDCANPGVLLGSAEAQKMTEISGQRWLPLLKSYNLDGSLAKMCEALLTSQWASSAAFLTWKASATKPSHLLFQLAPSMPRTDETASGLWRTPDANMGNCGPKSREMYEESLRTGVHAITLNDQVKMWPTARSCSAMAAANIENRVNDKFSNLEREVARSLWPTVRASDWKGARTPEQLKRVGRTASNSLGDAVRATAPSGSLNPQWVEWLQGYEIGHTDLGHWEMPSSRKSLNKSEEQLSLHKTKQETAHDE
jgi:hypothetical protein